MLEFKLPDMTCGHCASRVTAALKRADPGCEVHIDLRSQRVQVESDEDAASLAEALHRAGYPPA
ncbi:MAG: heavy-metal-associated domain-containing protein [Rubrivivax sp.]|nr:heavy-metal-associated domain-containing protein [Rubrivivax sp.]